MEAGKQNRKIITVSFFLAAFLTHIVTRVLFETLGGMVAIVERWRSQDLFRHGVPLFIALVVFVLLQMNPKVVAWADEVVHEIKKIVWPTQRDTVVTTFAVCVMVLIAGLGLAGIDYMSSVLISWIVK
ncbi:MAG: preprotein translocase subunit SecE [Bdellovibrionales bacterium]|nr:preprotein translocase subunit SecE [Bdellovibrionales bacterium]